MVLVITGPPTASLVTAFTHQLQEWSNSVKKTLDFDALNLHWARPWEVGPGVLAEREQGVCAVLEGHVIVLPLQWRTRLFTWPFSSSVFHDSGTKILNMRKEWVWLKDSAKGWRDGSATKSTCCSWRETGFGAQVQLLGSSQLTLIPVPEDDGLLRCLMHAVNIHSEGHT